MVWKGLVSEQKADTQQASQPALKTFSGSCHCGSVRFCVSAPDAVEIERCNCSICTKSGYLHLIVPRARFTLESDWSQLNCYQFNTMVAKHYFCKTCGVKPFYVARSNPDGMDINLNCLDERPSSINIVDFDGQNWEANAASLAHKSKTD
ncbi:MAG: GFA family protein [Congregibacter sp.]